MFRFEGDYLHLELTPQQVEWLRFACEQARDASADSGDDQLHAGLITFAGLFAMAEAVAQSGRVVRRAGANGLRPGAG